MRTVLYTRYGSPDVLHLADIPKPTPTDHEILVKIRATTVTIGDTIMRSLKIPGPGWQKLASRLYLGIRAPKRQVLGMELAGEVEHVGKKVTRFKPGDPVFASTFAMNFGGYAEYKCLPENGVVAIKPGNMTFEEAAALPGAGMTALQILRRADIRRGQSVLIYGASGAVGTYAVQIAKSYGAVVTGVCSGANRELVTSLGADRVIDYTREDFTQLGAAYDLLFDAVGKLDPVRGKTALKPNGVYLNVLAAADGANTLENLNALKALVEAGSVKPAIDRCYRLEQVVEAHRYVDQGHKKGNVVIVV